MTSLSRGTSYGDEAIAGYAKSAHGADMGVFLYPFIQKDLSSLKGKQMLDAGCGAAPWSIYAATHGAEVTGIDLQEGMIAKAQEAIKAAGVSVKAEVGDATNLSFKDGSFDHVLSSLVGCNLPSAIFASHFTEIGRVLRTGGTATISIPASLNVVFTNGKATSEQAIEVMGKVLDSLPDDASDDEVRQGLNQLEEVVSATFTKVGKRLQLVTDLSKLESGQRVWRKLAHVTIPNHFHAESEYAAAFEKAKLKIERVSARTIGAEDRAEINETEGVHPTLGASYENHAPFKVYHLVKQQCTLL